MNEYINILIKEAQCAAQKKEVPIGAIVVYKNRIIAKSYNKRIKNHDVTSHAEINAIRKAEKKLGDWRLDECDLYVTLEPCHMCIEVIKEARLRNVYYLLSRNPQKHSYNKTNICSMEKDFPVESDDYRQILSTFFKLNGKRK